MNDTFKWAQSNTQTRDSYHVMHLQFPGRIRDEETDLWQKELQSIDAARKDNMAEEDLLKIHRGIITLAFPYAALEKRVQALEQFKHRVEAGTL